MSAIGPKSPSTVHHPDLDPWTFCSMIDGIVLGKTTIVTTALPHPFEVGDRIKFVIPPTFGTKQLDQKTCKITAIYHNDSFEVDLDSRGMSEFILCKSHGPISPMVYKVTDKCK